MNVDVLSIILKFCSFDTLLNIKLVNKDCCYLVNLEINNRLKISITQNSIISQDYLSINYISKLSRQTFDTTRLLQLLCILYKLYDNSFEPFDWYLYNLPMKLLYMATTDDEFDTVFQHWLIQKYLADLPGLWSREEIFMTWYDKINFVRQKILKRHVLKLYNCPEEYIFILTRMNPGQHIVFNEQDLLI